MFDIIFEAIITFFDLHFFGGRRGRRDDWNGIVVEKKTKGDYSVGKYKCYVVFKTDEGKLKKIKMDETEFLNYELQKRYHKSPGNLFPHPYNQG